MNALPCPNCQQLVTAGVAFCGRCGQQFAQAPPSALANTPPVAPVVAPPPASAPQPTTPVPPQPGAPVAQPPHAAFNQQPPPTDLSEDEKEASYLVMALLFGGGLLITIIPILFLDFIVYVIQFGFAAGLFQQARKARDKNKMMVGYALTGLMAIMGVIAIFIAFRYGE